MDKKRFVSPEVTVSQASNTNLICYTTIEGGGEGGPGIAAGKDRDKKDNHNWNSLW